MWRIYIKLLGESIRFAFGAMLENKLRTFLSLLGVTIGIFAIISVFTMVDSIKRNIDNSIASLGDNVIYIQKWPWTFSSDYPWWKYMNRPVVQLDELQEVKRRSQLAANMAFTATGMTTVIHEGNMAEFVKVVGVTDEYEQIKNFEIASGRYLSPSEINSGANYAVLGADLAEELFGNVDPVGNEVTIRNKVARVIGVFKKEGDNIIDFGNDNAMVIPINLLRYNVDIKSDAVNPLIMAKAAPGITNQELIEELYGIMRAIRRLAPDEDDNFSLNETKLISNTFDQLIAIVNSAGWFIGVFSILVGGFGIANIMFVSVKERTNIIGIQKSLGAKRFFILFQFLVESVMLCLTGGVIGLLLIFLLTLFAQYFADVELALSLNNILMGIGISSIIGLVCGIAPALTASRLDPVEAIRAN
ncbi:MAG: ABC transporter permease [Flavobacteriales bacterium]